MDVIVPGGGSPAVLRPMGRNTARTVATKGHWAAVVREAPHVFANASDKVEVSPDLSAYCPGGYDNQIIGMCVGKATKNLCGTILRIPPDARFDPSDPSRITPRGPNIRLSGLYCYWNARNFHGDPGGGEGAVVAYALDALGSVGVVLEVLWPDTEANQRAFSDARRPDPRLLKEGARHAVLKSARITSKQMFYDYLAVGYPVSIGKPIPQGMMNTAEDGRYSIAGRWVGGHNTVIVHYDRRRGLYKERNSWMPWGAVTDDPEFNTDDPAYGGNAGGRNSVGYSDLQQFEDTYLVQSRIDSGEVDMFVVNEVPWDRAVPKVAMISAVEEFA
jgi:hypothetical protein